ncbi:unnamed protein product [Dicrocoelium dendriticum]|nr:unnamed protein product [Dicrocoelium dendriticum]
MFSIACGTYDGSLFVLTYEHENNDVEGAKILKPVLLDPNAHNGPVGGIAISNSTVVSGGEDGIIQVFSLEASARLGSLEVHMSAIKHLAFAPTLPGNRIPHIVSTCEDGGMGIWRQVSSDSWECIRFLRKHKGAVLSVTIHPSSRCAFTIGEDKTFRIWNLMRGREAHVTHLKRVDSTVHTAIISPSGKRLLLLRPDRADLIDMHECDNHCLGRISLPCPWTSPCFFNEDDIDSQDKGGAATDMFVHLVSGCGCNLQAFRCLISPQESRTQGEIESFGSIRLPGKRIKAIVVASWLDSHARSRLIVTAATDASGSYIRGHAVNMDVPLDYGHSVIPVFTYDVANVRVTAVSAAWTNAECCDETE